MKISKIVTGDMVRHPKKTNFVPRIGAAYRINNDTVIRGGYGRFTETLGTYAATQGGGPFQLTETFFNNAQGQPLFTFPNPFPRIVQIIGLEPFVTCPCGAGVRRRHQRNGNCNRTREEKSSG